MTDTNHHIQQIRQEMPVTTTHIYLNAGTFGPMPLCVIQAVQERFQEEWREGRLGAHSFQVMNELYMEARARSARIFNAAPEEIALTDNTGEGLNIVCYGRNWQEGDEVIITNHEHISALAPLYQIRDRYGIVLRTADLGPIGDQPIVEAISEQITPQTRLIVLSHISFMTGTVFDIGAVTALAHAREIPVLVDGAQAAGVIPLDMQTLDVDFYAIPMQKWLCGPNGTGALYVRRESLKHVQATYVGYYSMKHEEGVEGWQLNDTAQRFELGGRQTAALAGQVAVLRWLEDVIGLPWVYERVANLNAYAATVIAKVPGVTILTPKPGASGLLAFTYDEHDPEEVVQHLADDHNIYIRSIHERNALRIAPGFYNTEEEIDSLARALRTL